MTGSIEQRPLGSSGLTVAPLALGGNVFGWTVGEAASFRVLDAFVDAGMNLIDTADVYSRWIPGHQGGESEAVLGKWLTGSGKRDRVVLATKVGMDMGPGSGLSRAHIIRSVEASLQRLQTDRIDLYQAHKDDPATPLDETLAAFASLIQAGKVRAIGASNYSADRLAEALAVSKAHNLPRYMTMQPEYNLVARPSFEGPLQDLCVAEDLAVIPYFSLASGFLTGKYRTEADLAGRARASGAGKYLNDAGRRVLAALDNVAARLSARPAHVAIAWLLTRPAIAAPIASATSVEQLQDLVAGVELHLDAAAVTELDQASA